MLMIMTMMMAEADPKILRGNKQTKNDPRVGDKNNFFITNNNF